MRPAVGVVALVFVLAGCPHAEPQPHDEDAGGGPDASGITPLVLTCNSDMTEMPPFERHCSAPADCVIALHQIDCCGSMTAHGIRAGDESAFSAAESACAIQFPGCGCPPQPTVAEDGDSEGAGTIMVTCEAGRCTTFVP